MSALWLKVCGAVLLSAAGILAGFLFARRLTTRRRFFREFSAFLTALKTSLRYRNEDIFTLVSRSGTLFAIVKNNGSLPFEAAWKSAVADFPKRWCLNTGDMTLLYDFGAGLGKTDYEGQLAHIEWYAAACEKRRQEADGDVRQKARLYKALGMFAGVSAAILFL